MADVTAKISLVDEMSEKLDQIADSGQSMLDSLSGMEDLANSAFSGVENSAASVATAVDGVATSVDQSSSAMDSWTDAASGYNTSALEAIYSTEELVDMGLKSADALEEENRMLDLCTQSQENLANAVEASVDIHEELNSALESAADLMDEVAKSDEVSADTKERLAKAYEEAQDAMQELENAQQDAADAQAYYDSVMESSTASMAELESAAERVQLSAEDLESANERAATATEELGSASSAASDEMNDASSSASDFGENSMDAINGLASALVAAGIVKLVQEIAEAFLDAADAAAEFETSIAKVETIADTSQISIGEIKDQIVDLSNDTGQSVNDLSESVYQAISASVDTEDAVAFTASATQLAVGGFTDTTTAVDVLTTAINAYGLEADKATDISDMLVQTQNLGKTTVDELSSSIGKVIPLASAYNVGLDNLTTAYAEMTKSGITTAESGTYLRSMLQELGDTSSNVSDILVEQTGSSFSELMDQGYSLGDVLDVLGDSVNGNSTAFSNLWSNQRAGIGALSLYNSGVEEFNGTLEEMQDSVGATSEAYETMTDTTEHAKDKMVNAADNLKIAFGESLNSALEPLYEIVGNILNKFNEFVSEHPGVVKAITAIATAAVALVAGIAAVAAITTAASAAMTALGGAMSAALGPVAAVVAAVAGVVAIVEILKDRYDEAYDSMWEMNAATENQVSELDQLQSEYEAACEQYGATSEEASRLKYEIDDLTEYIENNGRSVQDWCDDLQAITDKWNDLKQAYEDAIEAIDQEETSNFALIQKLDDLASSTDQTAGSQQVMENIINELNSSIDGLNLTYDDLINNQDAVIESLKKMAEEQAEQERFNAMYDEYVGILRDLPDAEAELERSTSDLSEEQARYNDVLDAYNEKWGAAEYDTSGILGFAASHSVLGAQLEAETDILDEVQAKYDEASNSVNEMTARQAELEEALGLTTDSVENFSETTMSETEAAAYAFDAVQGEIEELCQAYADAYEAALESFEGQFGLFDQAEANMDASVEAAQAALDSQLAYWENYNSNIEVLRETSAEDLGITQESYEQLMAYVQDGSEEAAGLASSMVEAIESGNEEALSTLATTMEEVSAQREAAAEATAEWQTDITGRFEEVAEEMQTLISEDLNLSDEATASAMATIEAYVNQVVTSGAAAGPAADAIAQEVGTDLENSAGASASGQTTMDAYAAAITSSGASAVSAAQSIASQVSAALASANTSISVGVSSTGYASGTTDSVDTFIAGEYGPELVVPAHAAGSLDGEDYYMAGEQGPELIVGEPGSTVFPTSETERLINALSNNQEPINVENIFKGVKTSGGASNEKGDGGEGESKRIIIEIAGSGEMTFSGDGDNSEAILEMLQDNLKPVLMKIIRQEIYEEGERSYVY